MAQKFPLILPWQWFMTAKPIEDCVQQNDEVERRNLTRSWRQDKLAELSWVGLTSALVTSAYASAIGWQTVGLLPYVLGIWFAGLILTLTSIYIATHQSIALHRLGNSDSGVDKLVNSMGYGRATIRKSQVLVWQMPVMLLNLSIFVFIIGLLCQVLNTYKVTRKDLEMILTILGLGFSVLCVVFTLITMDSAMA